MRLPAEDRRKQLLETAMRLFAEQGFDGTSTREIADAAGINEAMIFRHFPTKEDLYWAVVEHRIATAGRDRKIRAVLDSGKDDREILAGIAVSLLDRGRDDEAFTRLLFYSALRNRDLSDKFFRSYVADSFETVASYIRQRIAEGKFRRVNPLVAARGFMGMVIYHYLVQELFGGSRFQQFDSREVARELAGIFLEGMATAKSKSASAAGKQKSRQRNGAAVLANNHH